MEFIEIYKGIKIFKSNGFYTTGVMGADFANLQMLKMIISKKISK